MSTVSMKPKTEATKDKFDMSKLTLRKPRVRLDTKYDYASLAVGEGFKGIPVAIAGTVTSGAHGYAGKLKDKDGKPTVRFQTQKAKDKKTVDLVRIA